jgi:ABC-2 type transport system ATP-binding protein
MLAALAAGLIGVVWFEAYKVRAHRSADAQCHADAVPPYLRGRCDVAGQIAGSVATVPFMKLPRAVTTPRGWLGRRLRGRRLAAGLAAAAVAVAAVAALAVVSSGRTPVSVRNLRIGVTDGPRGDQHVVLDTSFFTPSGSGRIPAILLAHGFGETKDSVRAQAVRLARDGFAVLTWSARGFGASTGQTALDSPDYEVKDTQQLVTWLAHQPRVELDRPGDPRVGIAGASYGGGLALLAAAYDHRIDAIVPEMAWNNLATALFPDAAPGGPGGGVFKKQWAGLLFTQGAIGFGSPRAASQARPSAPGGYRSPPASPQCGRFLPQICAVYQQAATAGRPARQAIALLLRSSPASVANRIDAPTLLVQGENDSLFGLDQANANYAAIRAAGTPVDMVWFDGGHDGGDQEESRLDELTAQWFGRWLKPAHPAPASQGTGQPAFAVSRVLGFDPSSDSQLLGVATAPGYPGLDGTRQATVRLAGPPQAVVNPPGGAPPSMSVLPGVGLTLPASAGSSSVPGGLAFDIPGQSAAFTSAPLRTSLHVTGAPTVRIRVSDSSDVTLFAKLYDVDQAGNATLPYQLAAPLRLTAPLAASGATARPAADTTATPPAGGRPVTVQLPALDYGFAAGHRLRLVLTTTDFAYATPATPATYQVALAAPGVTVPTDPALVIQDGGAPWYVWAAPAAALAAATGILTIRRRRGADTFSPGLADVPLEIEGLTKRFGDGQLAVDDLSLRVERGQILGLLGPNGAGKTTTLRMLMGLIHPDAGTITIFGRRVHPGARALSRLGSFVEGPGFLPHLSGRANLDLYWRATGRPADAARMEEVLKVARLGAAIDRRVRAYSRGMRQRLAIAQAMLGLPDLLVLDEPMNGLDPPQIREMRDVLLGYAARGRTVILSSHLLGEVEQTCSHVVVMNQGRRLAAGPVREIIGDGAALVVGTAEAARAARVLSELSGIERAEPHPDGVLVHPNGVPASAVVAALVEAGIPVNTVTPNRRLEDAFLALIASPADGAVQVAAGDERQVARRDES